MSEMEIIEEKKLATKRKRGYHRVHFHLDDEMKQVFIGHHTIFSVLGFTVGGILIGGVLERILIAELGSWTTLGIGFVMLFASGLVLRIFND